MPPKRKSVEAGLADGSNEPPAKKVRLSWIGPLASMTARHKPLMSSSRHQQAATC